MTVFIALKLLFFFFRLVSHATIRVGICSSSIFTVSFNVIKVNSHLKGLLHTYNYYKNLGFQGEMPTHSLWATLQNVLKRNLFKLK